MTVKQILNATSMIQKLINLPLSPKKAYKIYKAAKQADEVREFVISEEKKLIEQYGVAAQSDGSLAFPTEEAKNMFSTQHADLLNCEMEFEELELKFDELGAAQFTALEMMALDGIVKFIE